MPCGWIRRMIWNCRRSFYIHRCLHSCMAFCLGILLRVSPASVLCLSINMTLMRKLFCNMQFCPIQYSVFSKSYSNNLMDRKASNTILEIKTFFGEIRYHPIENPRIYLSHPRNWSSLYSYLRTDTHIRNKTNTRLDLDLYCRLVSCARQTDSWSSLTQKNWSWTRR